MFGFSTLVCLASLIGLGLAISPTESYRQQLELMPDGVYQLYWKFNETDITFEVHVKTLGWIGFGLSTDGDMPGADVVIGWVEPSGIVKFHDRHAVSRSRPTIDQTQNWFVLHGAENSTHTVLKFTRKLKTCDTDYDRDITDETLRLIFSFNPNDPVNDLPSYHGPNRATRSVLLLTGPKEVPLPPDAVHHDLIMSDVNVPAQDTTYWCQIFQAPALTSKHHIVRIDPLIQPGNEDLVHHILVYGCASSVDVSYAGYNDDCFIFDSSVFYQCFTYYYVWAIGGGPFILPEHVGLPFGEGFTSSLLRLEVHYDNPRQTAGRIDASGFRIWYTPTLRPVDAGFIEIGLELFEHQVFPKNFEELDAYGFCTKECFEQGMGSTNEIQIFATFPHAHLAGRKIQMKHVRDGRELRPLTTDNSYDFNFQETRMLANEVTFKKGDAITVRCTYNTTDRNATTKVGFGTRDEMCFGFIYYYPAINLHRCDSLLEQYESLSYLGLRLEQKNGEWVVASKGRFQGMNLFEAVEATDWTKKSRRKAFQRATRGGDIVNYCYGDQLEPHPINEQTTRSTQITKKYVAPTNGC